MPDDRDRSTKGERKAGFARPIFMTGPAPNTPLLERIEKACRGLTYISETDAAVEPFAGGRAERVSAEAVIDAAGLEQGSPVEEADPSEFFGRLTAIRDWYTPRQQRDARRFARLERILLENLTDLRVFRIGRIRIAIFVVGKDAEGDLLGVKTSAVET